MHCLFPLQGFHSKSKESEHRTIALYLENADRVTYTASSPVCELTAKLNSVSLATKKTWTEDKPAGLGLHENKTEDVVMLAGPGALCKRFVK